MECNKRRERNKDCNEMHFVYYAQLIEHKLNWSRNHIFSLHIQFKKKAKYCVVLSRKSKCLISNREQSNEWKVKMNQMT